jgi:hypothetical protein
MRRHITGILIDWAKNRHLFNREKALPPAHLLRKAFEEAKDYAAAKEMLATTPVSIPVIYTLAGTKEGEGCVIERTERTAAVREFGSNGRVVATNHFESGLNGTGHGWKPRTHDSGDRAACANTLPIAQFANDFEWFKAPIANYESRLAMVANAETGEFKVIGTAGATPVTKIFRMEKSA